MNKRMTLRNTGKFILVYLISIFIFNIDAFTQDPKWLAQLKQVQPLVSTQQDIEKLIRKKEKASPPDSWYYLIKYETKFGDWFVTYSNGKCSEKKKEGYDVQNGVVLKVHFVLRKYISFSSLNLNLDKFEKYKESDTNNIFYSDDEAGISYTKGGRDVLGSINIFPSKRYRNLACSGR